jgi:hypothetical protein
MTNHPIKGKYVIIVISIFSTQPNPLQISRGTLVYMYFFVGKDEILT